LSDKINNHNFFNTDFLKMRILLVGTLPPELGSKNYGGVARVVWNLAKTLKKNGSDVTIGGIGKYYKKYQQKSGIDIYGIGFSLFVLLEASFLMVRQIPAIEIHSFSLRHLYKLFYSVYYLLYLNKRVEFDIIHVHHVTNQIPYAVKLTGLNVKVISTIHSYSSLVNDELKREKENINIQLKQSDYITHVSEHLKNIGIRKGIKWESSSEVIYNGVQSINNETRHNTDPVQVCFVGSVTRNKGIDRLIACLNHVGKSKDLELVIVGRGDYEKTIRDNVDKYNYKVTLTGQLNNTLAIETIAKASVLVNPSKSESFGLVYLESLGAGTPVIGYKPLIEEFISYFGIGKSPLKRWLISYDYHTESSEELADKILKILEIKSSNTYQSERIKIIEMVKSNFNWNKIACEYSKLYIEI